MALYSGSPQSWGRTRGPKNIAGPPGTEITCTAAADLKGITASTAGYATENQRYLHVLVEDATTSDDPGAVTIFGYCHTFQRWFEISGAQELSNHVGADATNDVPTPSSIDIGNISARAPAAQEPGDREYRVYGIVGIDRVAFVNGTPAEVNIFAAGSTF